MVLSIFVGYKEYGVFIVYRKNGRYMAKCEECGHIQAISNTQAIGDRIIECQGCGVSDYA